MRFRFLPLVVLAPLALVFVTVDARAEPKPVAKHGGSHKPKAAKPARPKPAAKTKPRVKPVDPSSKPKTAKPKKQPHAKTGAADT